MMYQDKMAVAIKVGGKVLREKDDTVFIPFGSEYTIYVKNMNSVRALVRFQIDGTDATDGVSVIVPANGHIEIERFLKAGNMSSGLKFKFIERTAKIEDGPRGIKVEDGLIRVEFEFEREPAKIVTPPVVWPSPYYGRDVHHHHHYGSRSIGAHDLLARGVSKGGDEMFSASSASFSGGAAAAAADYDGDIGEVTRGITKAAKVTASSASMNNTRSAHRLTASSASRGSSLAAGPSLNSMSLSDSYGDGDAMAAMDWMDQEQKREITPAREVNDKGITVGGSRSNQEFTQGSWFPTDGVKHVLVLKILGETKSGKAVEAPVTVKTKVECPTCGTKNKAGKKFCSECGTGLEQV